jgi:two-component system cell cycle response regulator DivK
MLNQYTYLYVEDDEMSREVMQVIVENAMGIDSLTMFEDSAQFIDKVYKLPSLPDVFMLDIHMKPYSGFELLKMIRADATLQQAVVIALTASVMSDEIIKLQQSGFDGAIAKPLDIHTFPSLLERILNHEKIWHIS